MKLSVDADALSAAAGMRRATLATVALVHTVTVAHGAMLQRQTVENASGRPGPNVITGNYRRSINRRSVKRARGSETTVGSNAPQARRLELGFVGVDDLGRSFDQAPFPHFGPALDAIAPKYESALGAAIANTEEQA